MYYGDDVIEEVRVRNDIVDVISQSVHLKKRGSGYVGLCPFHNERTPSFSVTPSKQMFYCFGCGTGGNVFTFVQKYDGLSFMEAVEHLAERAGYALPKADPDGKAKKARDRRNVLMEINKEAAVWFYYRLREERGKAGSAYFDRRGLSEETRRRFGLGFAPVTRDALVSYLRAKGYEDRQILDAGVAVMDEAHGLRDKFWNRVMFPIQDVRGRVIGFGGRVLGDGEPKYLNSPETPVFDKSRNLYGLSYAKNARRGHLILCEGYMDVIAMHQAGFPEAVASLGTSFTIGQANILRRYTEEVVLAYDSDEAGTRAALRGVEICRAASLKPRILRLAPYKDPDELITKEGAQEMEKRILQAENPFLFEVGVNERRFNLREPDEKTAFCNRVAELLALRFREPIERENYLQSVCAAYHIDPQDMKDMVARFALRGIADTDADEMPAPAPRPVRTGNTADERLTAQRRLLSWMAGEKALYGVVSRYLNPSDFAKGLYRTIATEMFRELGEGTFEAARMIERFEEGDERNEAVRVLSEPADEVSSEEDRAHVLHEMIEDILAYAAEEIKKEADSADRDYLKTITEAKKRKEAFARTRL